MIAQAIELNNRPHVVVATPGRIVDHLKSSSGEWDLSRVKFLVSCYRNYHSKLAFLTFERLLCVRSLMRQTVCLPQVLHPS